MLSNEEELQIIGAVLDSLPSDLLNQALPWEMSFLDVDEIIEDREVYQRTLSAEKQRAFIGAITSGLPPERWQAAVQKRPAFSSYKS